MNTKDQTRFWSKITKTESCWLWKNPSHPFGYGRFKFNNKIQLAHRVSYKLYNRDITSSECVLHKCDNPGCVNPDHLFLGSRKDNALDRTMKGRTLRGSQVPTSIFKEQDILDIRSSSLSINQLAKQYNTGYGTIWTIVKRKTWKHI
jgi:hypothetical protein